jgi:predicted DNA-binding transcriptional regulator YafY
LRNAEVIRQWKILKRIEAGRYTSTADLAEEHEVTERTIRRDIEALQEAGFPLYDERSDGRKLWRLVDGYKQRLTQTFTLAELAALYFGKNLMSFLGGAPFAADLESAFAKIREALPAKSLPYLARIQDLFSARPDPWKDYSKKQDVITALIDATLHQRQVRIEYFSFNSRKTKSYTLDPYRVVYYHASKSWTRRSRCPPTSTSRSTPAGPSASPEGSPRRWRWSSTRRWRVTSASGSGTRASRFTTDRPAPWSSR